MNILNLYKSGNSYHITIPIEYLKLYKREYGVMPDAVKLDATTKHKMTIQLLKPAKKTTCPKHNVVYEVGFECPMCESEKEK